MTSFYKRKKEKHWECDLGVFSSSSILKYFGFWFIILYNRTKYHIKILAKKWLFSILDFGLKERKKKPKRASRGSHEGNKLYILDETKYNPENFGISHFMIPK